VLHVSRSFDAYLDALNIVTILVPKIHYQGQSSYFRLQCEDSLSKLKILNKEELEKHIKYTCEIEGSISLGKEYSVYDEHGTSTDLQIGAVIRTKSFDDQYAYEGNDLGANYSEQSCTFKVWAPTATAARLRLVFQTGDMETLEMERQERGVWTITVERNLEGAYYSYLICVNLIWKEAVDPYAKAISINGEYGVVADLTKTMQLTSPLPPFPNPTEAIIYEAHIRDFSIHPKSGMKHKGKFLAWTEKNTKNEDGTITGISYLQDLGITHVELLPIYDFAGVDEKEPEKLYNWGYNPLHFNAPEGSYSTDPKNPYSRINELKQAIHSLHESGIRVIMDVVYNHVYIREESSFEKIVPGYYFRHDANGMPSNGTGVGNDIASERKMVRKFIIDSIMYWLKEYDIDGFRFDLMGILDIETMNAIRQAIDSVKPGVILIGEGWELNTPLDSENKATIGNAAKMPRIAHFNDRFRDCIKGSTFNVYDRGFALGNVHRQHEVKQSIAGSISMKKGEKGLFLEPDQTVNYVESHDNHTLWDKLTVCNSQEEEAVRCKRQRLATSIVLLSQGIPFLHAGQEFYRTKQGVENSYNSPDSINQLDWERKKIFEKDIDFIKGLIRIRKHHKAFAFPKAALIRKHLYFIDSPDGVIMYRLTNVSEFGPWKEIIVIHHNGLNPTEVDIQDDGNWSVACDGEKAGIEALFGIKGNKVHVPDISTLVLFQQ
jgi:pullulanase